MKTDLDEFVEQWLELYEADLNNLHQELMHIYAYTGERPTELIVPEMTILGLKVKFGNVSELTIR